MREINDLFELLNQFLSKQAIISQCVITDYVTKDGKSTCTALLPNVKSNEEKKSLETTDDTIEFKNITCFLGTIIDITFKDYMQGILINLQNSYATAQEISSQKPKQKYDYFNITADNLIAIVLPHSETITNLLTAKIIASDALKLQAKTLYVGDKDNNLILQLAQYLKEFSDFFDKFSQNAPTLSSYPGNGSAAMQAESTRMKKITDDFYDIIKPMSEYKDDKEE